MTLVTRETLFPAEPTGRLLRLAEDAGVDVSLVKDEGAYLIANLPGAAAEVDGAVVYAEGHTPPPRPSRLELGAEDPWMVARVATEQVWGGDDFSDSYTTAELRAALGPRGIRVVTELDCFEMPESLPTGPWGRRDPICHLEVVTLEPAT